MEARVTNYRRLSAIVLIAGITLGIAAARSSTIAAQQPNPQTVTPGTAAIWTDQAQYNIGDSITICYRVPTSGNITITDYPPDGSSQVIYSGPSNGTEGCVLGTVIPPAGTECIRLTYTQPSGAAGQAQTCFTVIGSAPPPTPSTGVNIYTDRTSYQSGDRFTTCYTVPAPGPVVILDTIATGATDTFASGYDDGTGGCVPGTIGGTPGTECLTLIYTYPPTGVELTDQTCFAVGGAAAASWTNVGSALIEASGNWWYSQPIQFGPTPTYVRVTSGNCEDSPNSVAAWESAYVYQGVSSAGIETWTGDLLPVGLTTTASVYVSGLARLTRPVSSNPVTQVDLTLYNIPAQYQGIRLNICLR
jgi:hypothetical protein